MKHYIAYATLFCINAFQIIHPALNRMHKEKYTAPRNGVLQTPSEPTANQVLGNPMEMQVSFVPIASSDYSDCEEPETKISANDTNQDALRPQTSRQKFHDCLRRATIIQRRSSENTSPPISPLTKPISPLTKTVNNHVTFTSLDQEEPETKISANDTNQDELRPQTSRQKFYNCIQEVQRRVSVTAIPPISPSKTIGDIAFPLPNFKDSVHQDTDEQHRLDEHRRLSVTAIPITSPSKTMDDFIFPLPNPKGSVHQNSDSDDEVIEMPHNKDIAVGTDPERPNTWKYIAIGSTSALTTATVTYGVMCWLRPQRHSRMFTGFEIPAAFAAKDMLAGIASKLALGAMAIYAWRQLHAPCRKALIATEAQLEADKRGISADYKDKLREHKLKMKEAQEEFEKKITARQSEHEQRTVLQITDVAQQVEVALVRSREDTQRIILPLIEALGHAGDIFESQATTLGQPIAISEAQINAADILHTAVDQATKETRAQTTQGTHIIPPPPPKEPVEGCCGIKWPWNN